MTIQTLVVTTMQSDHSLLNQMNIQTDAIIGNQCNQSIIEKFDHHGHHIQWYSLQERGVGLNRNNVLMRSNADICVFADDDMVFHDGYAEIVVALFEKNPDIDIIVFNLDEKTPTHHKNAKTIRINTWNYGKYGAARFAFRRKRIQMAGIMFNLCFGGGADFSSGEDSIFLYDCLKKRLKVIAVPFAIAELKDERESTWFTGYNDKFFFDKGVFYAKVYGKLGVLVALYNCIKHRNGRYYSYGWKQAFYKMREGCYFYFDNYG